MQNESAEEIWNTLLKCWVSLYTGFPYVISHDKGSAFTYSFFKRACRQFGIVAKEVPTEAHNALSVGERYHAPLKRIYTKIRMQYPTLEKDVALSIALMGLNNTAGPEGLTPTLLVFGAVPRLPIGHIDTMIPKQRERLHALELARKEMETITAQLRIKVARRDRQRVLNVLDLKYGDPVLVYREKSKRWEGPYKFIGQHRTTIIVESARGSKFEFPYVTVKPYYGNSTLCMTMKELSKVHAPDPCDITTEATKATDAAEICTIVIVNDPHDPRFDEPKKQEMKDLINRGAFKIVDRSEVPEDANVLHGRFVLAIKEPETPQQKF